MAKLKAGQKVKQAFLVKTVFIAKEGDVVLSKEQIRMALETTDKIPVVFGVKVSKVAGKKKK